VATEVPPEEVRLPDYCVIDVRPLGIRARRIAGSVHVPIDQLLTDADRYLGPVGEPVLLICDIGVRSRHAAERLTAAGFTVSSLEGGIEAWAAAGLPTEDDPALDASQRRRYDRHIKLAGFGIAGQVAVGRATVTVVGAGGLGVPVAQYLAAAGVGTLRIIDPDVVEVSNLQRQPAYSMDDLGRPKVAALTERLAATNPSIRLEALDRELDAGTAMDLLDGSTLVVDATDRFDARYAINDAAQCLGVPDVFAAVYRWEGQLAVFAPGGPCYRCVFPESPDPGTALDCAVTGVLGPAVGALGAMQATEALRVLATPDEVSTDRLRLFDARSGSLESLPIRRRPGCPACSRSGAADPAGG
jgi:molybdopterin/thiamine biosynthesis adenylyltransferase/rhodanese-related sulfurtransferase